MTKKNCLIHKRREKQHKKLLFSISAGFVYFFLASTSLQITIIRWESQPVMFLQHQHITVCIFICCKVHDCWENTSPCLRFLPQILSRIFFRLTPCRNKHLSHKCSCTFSVVTQFAYMVRRRVARDIKIARRKNTIINFSPSHSPSNVTLLKYSYNKNQSSIIASSQWCREM